MERNMVDQHSGMVYDITDYIKRRNASKQAITLPEFYDLTKNNELFLIEYTDPNDNDNHVIIWARRPTLTSYIPNMPTIKFYDARIFDELPNYRTRQERVECVTNSLHEIKLANILAIR